MANTQSDALDKSVLAPVETGAQSEDPQTADGASDLAANPSGDDCRREISVSIPADAIAIEMTNVIKKFQTQAKIPGFRKGKAPASLLRSRFAGEIKSEVLEALIPAYLRDELQKSGLSPVSQPRITHLDWRPSEATQFTATFEVLPSVEVKGYKELNVEHRDISVSDEEVEKAFLELREQHATFEAIDGRALAEGDFAQASFTGTPLKKNPEDESHPVTVDDVLIEIGGEGTVPEFSENLRGALPGEQREFEASYPADFHDKRLAGQTMSYKVQVKGIKRKGLAELDDSFAKSIGQFETLDALRSRIREGMESERRHLIEHEGKDRLVDQLLESNNFAVPQSMVEHQIDMRLERGLRALAQQGMRMEDLKKMDVPRLRAGQRDAATREVRSSLILNRIAELEGITASDEEVNKELEALAAQTKQPSDALKARLTRDGGLDRLRERIRNEKTLDFLYRQSA